MIHLAQQLRMAGVACTCTDYTDTRLLAMARQARLAFVHRVSHDRYSESIIRAVKDNGGLVVFDTDDLVFDLRSFEWIDSPDFQDPLREKLYKEHLQRNRRTLDLCDLALTSTDFLAERVRECGKPAWVHRNAFSLEMLAASQKAAHLKRSPDGRVAIGYASGTPTHNRDFDTIRPALQAVLDRYPQADLHILGYLDLNTDWSRFEGRIRHLKPVSWVRLPELLVNLDINLAPLVTDNPFAQSKSEIKFMEAGMVGVPTVASLTDSFAYALRSGENGYLAVDTAGWQAALDALMDPDRRARVGQAAYRDVMERYHPAVRASQLLSTLQEALCGANRSDLYQELLSGAQVSASVDGEAFQAALSPANAEAHPTRIDQGLYLLRHRSPLELVRHVWVFFRRAIAPLIPYRKPPSRKASRPS